MKISYLHIINLLLLPHLLLYNFFFQFSLYFVYLLVLRYFFCLKVKPVPNTFWGFFSWFFFCDDCALLKYKWEVFEI